MINKKINNITVFSPSTRIELIDFAFQNKSILVAVNAEKILHATDQTRQIINRNVGYPDGIGAVWALKKKGAKQAVKIPGCELWLDIISNYHQLKTFYLVGGKQEVIDEMIQKLKEQYPAIQIVNYRNGYIKTDEEKQALLHDIELKKPDVVFVAMGSPKQELLMEEMHQLQPALYQGLGGSFDVFTGNVKRAPSWWVKNNLEWFYRLVQQPSRIKRQIHLVKFLVLLQFNKF